MKLADFKKIEIFFLTSRFSAEFTFSSGKCFGIEIGMGCLGPVGNWVSDYKETVGRQISSPTEVKHTVEQFIKHKLSSSFICIQWEYDFGYLDLITREELFRLPNLEENLNFVVTRLKEILSEKKLSKIYIATKPRSDILKLHELMNEEIVFSLKDFFDNKDSLAVFQHKSNTNTFASKLEQEICTKSDFFLGFPLSSWTQTVMLDRIAQNKNEIGSVLAEVILKSGLPIPGPPGYPRLLLQLSEADDLDSQAELQYKKAPNGYYNYIAADIRKLKEVRELETKTKDAASIQAQIQEFKKTFGDSSAGVTSENVAISDSESNFPLIPDSFKNIEYGVEKCTKPVHNLVYLKSHKTASSTVENILLRYGLKNMLNIALPLENEETIGGYPLKFSKKFVDPQLTNPDLVNPDPASPEVKYNMVCHHFRWSEEIRAVVPPDTMFLTSARSTIKKTISAFSHYRNEAPFKHWFSESETLTDRLKLFFEAPDKYYREDTESFFRAKNHLSFDLGYDGTNLDEVTKRFHFVVIADYFDESLVLMKEQLCWSWHNLIYIKFKLSYLKEKIVLLPEIESSILKWNNLDEDLFREFNNTFWERARTYGLDNLKRDADTVKYKHKNFLKKCLKGYQARKETPWVSEMVLRTKEVNSADVMNPDSCAYYRKF